MTSIPSQNILKISPKNYILINQTEKSCVVPFNQQLRFCCFASRVVEQNRVATNQYGIIIICGLWSIRVFHWSRCSIGPTSPLLILLGTFQPFFIGSKKSKAFTISLFVDKIRPKVKNPWTFQRWAQITLY